MGIDYGMGSTNRDPETGIRYGVISQNSVLQVWADSSEPHYGDPTCPKCGNDVVGCDDESVPDLDEDEEATQYGHGCADYYCKRCNHTLDSADVYGDEPLSHFIEDGEYAAETILDGDIMICKSPFYTPSPFCSPCVPGAGNLDGAAEANDGANPLDAPDNTAQMPLISDCVAYCFGHDWFDSGVAPYPVYGVVSNRPCFPDDWYGRNTIAHGRFPGHHFVAVGIIPATAMKSDYCA